MSDESAMEAWVRIGKQGTVLWRLTRKDFPKLLSLYPNFLPTQIKDLDKNRFRGIEDQREDEDEDESDNEDEDEDEGENEGEKKRRKIIIDLGHWFYKRCHGCERDGCKRHHQCLEKLDSAVITTIVDEAFKRFDEDKRASAVSKLQELLNESQGPDLTKFEFGILILSAKYPNEVPFCSPELRDCIKDYATDAEAYTDDWGTESYAKDYALFKYRYDLVMQEIYELGHKPAAQEVEKVAYVLDYWSALRDTFIDHLDTRSAEWEKVPTPGANTIIRKGPGPRNPDRVCLPKIIAVKSISEYNSDAINYLSEIRVHATAKMDRSHLVKYYGWYLSRGHFHIAMELMCKDLEDLLTRKNKPIGWDKAVKKWTNETKKRIREPLRQLLAGLRELHAEGITHRDLKPRNVLLDKEHNVKITDFGVSKQARNRAQTTMTTGTGTTGYTAPEVLQLHEEFHGKYTKEADLWSLGCVVYRMIKGCQLFAHDQETKTEAGKKVRGLAENNWEGFASPEANLLKKLLCVDPVERSSAESALKSYNT